MEGLRINGGNLLITGGSGVLGSYIRELLKGKYEVVIADISRPQLDLNYVNVDLTKPFTLSKEFEICIHLAAHVGGIQYMTRHPVENIRDNPRMTTNLLDAAVDSNIKHFIYTSSSRVYENQTQFPTQEESIDSCPPPSSEYGMSKLIGERLCKAYNQQYGLKYTILRPSNVYGPYEDPDPEYAHVIPDLIRKVLPDKLPIKIYGDGQQTRTFTHGVDVARAYALSIDNKNAKNETFNISGNFETKIIELLRLIWGLTDHTEDLKIKQLPALPYDTRRRFPSNKKIYEKLRWKPLISLKEGVSETIEAIKRRRV